MADYKALKARVQELAEKAWDTSNIEVWFKKLAVEDIPRKTLLLDEVLAYKQQILERVQRRAEECEFLSHS
jgi:hypothetical protein